MLEDERIKNRAAEGGTFFSKKVSSLGLPPPKNFVAPGCCPKNRAASRREVISLSGISTSPCHVAGRSKYHFR
jgi:hypothetical protein